MSEYIPFLKIDCLCRVQTKGGGNFSHNQITYKVKDKTQLDAQLEAIGINSGGEDNDHQSWPFGDTQSCMTTHLLVLRQDK